MKIRPEIFEKASELINLCSDPHPGYPFSNFTCWVLSNLHANKMEHNLWKKMHKDKDRSPYDDWFGDAKNLDNQIMRQQCLAEAALNLREQGFAK